MYCLRIIHEKFIIVCSPHIFSFACNWSTESKFFPWLCWDRGGCSVTFRGFSFCDLICYRPGASLRNIRRIPAQSLAWLGLEVSLQQGKAKSYSPGFAEENFIGEDGMTYYYLYPGTLEKWRYGEVYSSTSFQTFGFQVNFTVNNLFGENWGTRRWTVLLSPAVYLQRFSSSIYRKTDEVKLTDGASSPDMNLGAGLNLSLRYKINEHIDLQLRTGGMWVNNTAFEGVTTVIRTKGNGLWTTGLSVIWNINRRQHKGGNLLYAPTSPYKNRIRTRTWRCM